MVRVVRKGRAVRNYRRFITEMVTNKNADKSDEETVHSMSHSDVFAAPDAALGLSPIF